MFQRRHYEWLARFAAMELNASQQRELAKALTRDNPAFKPERFRRAIETYIDQQSAVEG